MWSWARGGGGGVALFPSSYFLSGSRDTLALLSPYNIPLLSPHPAEWVPCLVLVSGPTSGTTRLPARGRLSRTGLLWQTWNRKLSGK